MDDGGWEGGGCMNYNRKEGVGGIAINLTFVARTNEEAQTGHLLNRDVQLGTRGLLFRPAG